MTFAHPPVAWAALALAPALALFFWWSWRRRRSLIDQFVPRRLQETLATGLSPSRARARAALLILGLAALLLALARPRYGAGDVEVAHRGLDILVAIDTSRSMLAEDAGPALSRLRRAKLAALDLAAAATTDRLGLIAFAGTAFVQCPLTFDDQAFRQSLETLDTDIIPEGGTAIGAAITTALNSIQSDQGNLPVLVILTDGEEHESGAVDTAQRARDLGVHVFTVGVGTARGEIIRLRDANGTQESYLKDDQGNVVKSSLNEALLREVAETTGGLYLPLQGPRAMVELYERALKPLPRVERATRSVHQFIERFQWPLACALLLFALETLLPESPRPRGRPRPVRLSHPTLARASALLLALAFGSALLATPRAVASPADAYRSYRKGDFAAAEQEYSRLADEHPLDSRLRFNAGYSAFRNKDYERAASHFNDTLRSPDLDLLHDAYYNLGNTAYALGDTTEDLEAKRKHWRQAVDHFKAALQLDPADTNASTNLQYVENRLQALPPPPENPDPQNQQNQQSQQNQDDQEDSDGQKKPNDQNSPGNDPRQNPSQDPSDSGDSPQDQDQSSPSQQNPEDPQENNPQDRKDPKDSQSPDSKNPPAQGESPQDSPGKNEKPGDGKDSQGSSGSQPQDASQSGSAQNAQGQPGEVTPDDRMTREQALRLLDAAKGEDKPMPLERHRVRRRVIKDW